MTIYNLAHSKGMPTAATKAMLLMQDTITDLQAREAEHLATITALATALDEARKGLEPFAEVAAWADRNGHDLLQFDMLLRKPDGHFAGHLHAQSPDFIAARSTLAIIKEIGGGWFSTDDFRRARTALNGETDHG